VNGLAQRIMEAHVPPYLMGRKIISVNVRSLLAGLDFHDKFEKGIREVLNAIYNHEATASIFIDDLHLLLGNPSGEVSEDDRVHLLRSVLFKKELHHCIATTTPTDYQTLTEKSPAFLSKFVMIPVEQPNIRETLSILRGLKHRYETSHGFAIADSALFETAALAAEYFPSQSLPRSAIELVDKTTAIIATTRDSGLEELKRMEKEKSQLVTKIAYLEIRMNNPYSYIENPSFQIEKARAELSGLEKMITSLRESHDILRSIRRDLHQQTARLEEFRSIYSKRELEGNVPGAADTLHDLILETQAHIDKAKLREEEAVGDLLKHMKDPSTKLFFANRVGPAQVRQIIRELTG
ncbi:P-loop containing nucleoside triphosphate hydrolase protein, partial [Hyaloscypha variabilis]